MNIVVYQCWMWALPLLIIDTTSSIPPTLYTAMERFYTKGTSPATQRSYKTGISQYTKFCRNFNLRRIPTLERTLLLFTTYLATQGLSYATIRVYLSAVRHAHVQEGCHHFFDSQFTPRVSLLLKGIRKESAKTDSSRIRLPITKKIMQQIRNLLTLQPATYQSTMLWAACCVAFFGFLRASEFTSPSQVSYDPACHLSLADITLDNRRSPTLVELHIKQSKTDPYREGASVFSLENQQECMPSWCYREIPLGTRKETRTSVPMAGRYQAHQVYLCIRLNHHSKKPQH